MRAPLFTHRGASMFRHLAFSLCALLALIPAARAGEPPLRIAVFEADVTPPIGTPLCDALCPPVKEIVDPLKARGIALVGAGNPIALCALDWVGIGNSGYGEFREGFAAASDTSRGRTAVHCLHQHDAPGCDFAADELLIPYGLGNKLFDVPFARS